MPTSWEINEWGYKINFSDFDFIIPTPILWGLEIVFLFTSIGMFTLAIRKGEFLSAFSF